VASCGSTGELFDAAAARMVRVAFHTGRRVQMLRGVVLTGEENDRQLPTPLMVVGNCPRAFLEKQTAAVNSTLPHQQQVELALFNGPLTTVVSGFPESLRTLKIALSMVQAKVAILPIKCIKC
jgi:malonyl CoA-acyl carrier protein transacylase